MARSEVWIHRCLSLLPARRGVLNSLLWNWDSEKGPSEFTSYNEKVFTEKKTRRIERLADGRDITRRSFAKLPTTLNVLLYPFALEILHCLFLCSAVAWIYALAPTSQILFQDDPGSAVEDQDLSPEKHCCALPTRWTRDFIGDLSSAATKTDIYMHRLAAVDHPLTFVAAKLNRLLWEHMRGTLRIFTVVERRTAVASFSLMIQWVKRLDVRNYIST